MAWLAIDQNSELLAHIESAKMGALGDESDVAAARIGTLEVLLESSHRGSPKEQSWVTCLHRATGRSVRNEQSLRYSVFLQVPHSFDDECTWGGEARLAGTQATAWTTESRSLGILRMTS